MPLRVVQAELDGHSVFAARFGPSIGWNRKLEVQVLELGWIVPPCGIHELEFVTSSDDQPCTDLRADAEPVDAWRRGTGPVRLDRDVEALRLESARRRRRPAAAVVRRQCRRPSGRRPTRRPLSCDRVREICGGLELARRPRRQCRRSPCRRTCRSLVLDPSPPVQRLQRTEPAEHRGAASVRPSPWRV